MKNCFSLVGPCQGWRTPVEIVAAEEETITEVDVIGMETEAKIIVETIMTTVTTDVREKIGNQIDKFCPD